MKVFALLLLIGCVFASSSEWSWQTGKEHVFEYSGRLLSGFPHLSSHYSGIGINATVIVQVLGPEKVQLIVENPKYVNVNERLQSKTSSYNGPDGANWRELYLPSMTTVDQKATSILQRPIIFSFNKGEIVKAQISRNEPEWSVNFKKALALLFQAKTDASAWEPQSNHVISPLSEGLNYWKVKEESIEGILETTYQLNELPKYMMKDKPYYVPRPELCPQDKYYELVKTRNIDSSSKRSSFIFYKPGNFRCSLPNCKEMWSRTTETRYIACGTRGGQGLVIQSIVNDFELTDQMLLGFKTEPLVSGNLQVLRLKEIRPTTPKPQPSDVVTLNNLMYEYTDKNYQQPQQQPGAPRVPRHIAQQPEELAKALPSNFLQAKLDNQPIDKQKIIQQIKQQVTEIVRLLQNPLQLQAGEKQVTMKTLTLARGMSILGRQELKQVYNSLKSQVQATEVLKRVFFDTVLMSGTPEAIIFLKQEIASGELPMYLALNLFLMLPNNLIVPTEAVLEELFELMKEHWIQECPTTKKIAYMSFTSLLQKACLSPDRHLTYPTFVFGEFCNPESPVVVNKWVPFLIQQLESSSMSWTQKNEIIVTLGMLPTKTVLSKLLPYVEGKPMTSEAVPRMTRLLALWSLTNIGKIVEPEIIEPMVQSIFANPAEITEIRIAAFNVILKLNPPMASFHRIAARTWTEQDMEVLKVVNTGLYSLKHQYETTLQPHTDYYHLAKKAFLTYPLIKKIPDLMPTSSSMFSAEYLPKLGAGYESLTNWIASNSSFLPLEMYNEVKYYLGAFQFKTHSLAFHVEGAENIYRKLAELITPLANGKTAQQLREEMARQMRESLHTEWRKVIEKLEITPRGSEHMSGSVFFNFLETTPLFFNFEQVTVDYIKERFLRNPFDLKDKIQGQTPFNYQSVTLLTSSQFLVPTDMGFPVTTEVHMPMSVSVTGDIDVVPTMQNPSLTFKAKVFYTSQMVGWTGTISPFTEESLVTAFDATQVMNLPSTIQFSLNVPNQHLKVSVKAEDQITQPINVIYYHNHPFTATKKFYDLTPINEKKVMIVSGEPVKENKVPFGGYVGLQLESHWITESPYVDLRSFIERLALYNYNPMNMYKFTYAPSIININNEPSIRRNEYRLKYYPAQSPTKVFNLDIQVGYASKANKTSNVVYKKIELGENLEWQERNKSPVMDAIQKVYPFSVKNETVELKSIHPERQENIVKTISPVKSMDTAQALTMKLTASIPGPRPLTWTYSATLVAGQSQLPAEKKYSSKWFLNMESKKTGSKIQVSGLLDMPVLPLWNVESLRSSLVNFRYHNAIKVQPAGQPAWSIEMNGNAKASNEQKEHSRQSKEAKECKKAMSNPSSLNKLSRPCEIVREQAATLDEVDFTITYSNMPKSFYNYEAIVFQTSKGILWPYIRQDEVTKGKSVNDQSTISVSILMHKTKPSFDLVIRRPHEHVYFSQIRIMYPLNLIFPMKAGFNNFKKFDRKVISQPLPAVCKVTDQLLTTFDNRSLPFHIDYCFHLMAADCSNQHNFGVLTRVMRPGNRREMKMYLGKHVILMTPSWRPSLHSYFPDIKITIDHEEVTLLPNKWIDLRSPFEDNQVVGKLFRTPNNVIQLKAPSYGIELTYDGDDFAIEATEYDKNKLCGLCGNQNGQPRDDLEGPKKCILSEPEVEIASYRINDLPLKCNSEKPLPYIIKQKLTKEQNQCPKFVEIPTKLTMSLRSWAGKCTILKHAVIRRSGEVCISKKPVVQCSPGCHVYKNELLKKLMPFACLFDDRVAEHYVKKANQGQLLPEMEARRTAFETVLPQPRSCVPASN